MQPKLAAVTIGRRTPALAASLLLGVLAFGTAAALERDEFVAGWPIALPDSEGVFDAPLTLDVYRTAQDIGQIAILDARGEPMPFYRVGAPVDSADEERVILGASPLYAAPRGGRAIADVSVASGANRTDVTLTRPAGEAEPEIVGFVVDARDVERAPIAVELDWRTLEQPFLIDVVIEHSTTLTGWRTVGRGSVAALSIDGARIQHDRVPIAGERGGYYRIGVSRAVPEWHVENVTLVRAEAASPAELESIRLAASDERPPEAPAEAVYFDAGGRLPIGAVSLDFAASNGWARASVAAANAPEGPWRTVIFSQLFYETVLQDLELASPPTDVGRREARYWRVMFEEGAQPPPFELDLRYPQESLRFSADGTPPYVLAAGTLSDAAGPDRTFAAVWSELEAAGGSAADAALEPRVELGGAAAIDAPFAFPWRRAALWAVLGIGVIAVAWMAVRLAREML